MPLLHHLARTGGTLISRCLASMQGVCLLSEISPLGTSHFNPLRQAADWYGLVQTDEIRELPDEQAFRDALLLISSRAAVRGLTLVVRDWSHLDWIGFPFVEPPPMQCSWQGIDHSNGDASPLVNSLDWLGPRCATVRHPVDQYLSTKSLGTLKASWNEAAVWRGMRKFAEAIQSMPWYRYEDFLADPVRTLQAICDTMGITYDPCWQQRWTSYDKITGDSVNKRRTMIRPTERKPLESGFWRSVRNNDDFYAALELLGYPIPEPLRRVRAARSSLVTNDRLQRADDDNDPHLRVAKDWDEIVVSQRQACAEDASDIEAHLRLAEALRWIGQIDEAANCLLSLAQRCDQFSEPVQLQLLQLVCDTLEKAERRFEAIEFRRRWAQLAPENKNNLFQTSLLLTGIGEVDESLAYSRRLLELDFDHLGAAANFLLYINYSDQYTAAEIANEHFRLGMRFTERPEKLVKQKRNLGDKLRVGYLGSDFFTHPVGKIILPILQAHDRQKFHVVVYHNGKKSDANTEATRKAVDQFKTIHGCDDDDVFRMIRSDELDVLIDLGGYTGGGNRLRVLSRRVAPVQASFLGYPNTSALQTIDYRITDRFADPPGLTENLYGEQLVWLDHAMLAWRPYEIAKDISVDTRGGPLLGVFNNVAKISPKAIRTYAAIMRRVPTSRLILKYGDRYGVSAMQNRYRREFAAHGVLPHRLEFRTQAESLAKHLRTMASVDLALDAFPYQGTMTSLECLAVGTQINVCDAPVN